MKTFGAVSLPPCFGIPARTFQRCRRLGALSTGSLGYFCSSVFLFSSSQMAELLFYMEKLRGLMRKYRHVVQRYHVQYLAQFDALVLNDTIQVALRGN